MKIGTWNIKQLQTKTKKVLDPIEAFKIHALSDTKKEDQMLFEYIEQNRFGITFKTRFSTNICCYNNSFNSIPGSTQLI